MSGRWGLMRDAVAGLVSVSAALLYDLDARQIGIAAWVGTLLGSVAVIYSAFFDDLPDRPARSVRRKMVEAAVAGTLMSLAAVVGPNLWLAQLLQGVHPDHAQLALLSEWTAFAIIIGRSITEHPFLVLPVALELLLRVRQAIAGGEHRSYYVSQSLGELGRFLILGFLLATLHAFNVPSLLSALSLAVLYVPAKILHPKD
jgi:hypothetical protein